MPFIPRPVKPPTRLALACQLPEEVRTLLRHYAEFLGSTQEYVVTETLRLAFRKDREFQAWLATTHPETQVTAGTSQATPADQPCQTDASADSHGRAVSSRQ
jgi:hypothetical protein